MGKHMAAQRGWYHHSSLVFCTPPLCVCHNRLINPGWSCWWYQRWWTFLLFLHPHRDGSLFIAPCCDHGGGKSKRGEKKTTRGWPCTTHTHMTDGQSRNYHATWWGGALLVHVISRPISVPNGGYIRCQRLDFNKLFCFMALHSPRSI